MAIKDIFKKTKKEVEPPKEKEVKKDTKDTPKTDEKKGEKRDSKTFLVKRPWISEKATILAEKRTHVFLVHPKANKNIIKNEIQDRYGVSVEKVRTIKYRGKRKRLGRIMGKRSGFKKAMVTIKEGDTIDFL